jgi:hypothetical protein
LWGRLFLSGWLRDIFVDNNLVPAFDVQAVDVATFHVGLAYDFPGMGDTVNPVFLLGFGFG